MKTKIRPLARTDYRLEVPARFELADQSFADSCLTTWLRYHVKLGTQSVPNLFGAGDEARTRYLHLGKVALYRMSYTRIGCGTLLIIASFLKMSSPFFNFFEINFLPLFLPLFLPVQPPRRPDMRSNPRHSLSSLPEP